MQSEQTLVTENINNSDGLTAKPEIFDLPNCIEKMKLEDFEKIKVVGRGALGKVYLVKRISDGKYYAMKIM